MGITQSIYSQKTAGSLMTTLVPIANLTDTLDKIKLKLSERDWGDIRVVYVVSDTQKLVGIIPINKILASSDNESVSTLSSKPKLSVLPSLSQEKLVKKAIQSDVESVAVVDNDPTSKNRTPTLCSHSKIAGSLKP
ncbi:CBS domain-containing protein [Legionella yabuuchiae]|uniref:CBS domain-containing protein n=1 Tax=Legionella yabuuchiae TaxID=376727 RepID=UPI0010547B33|nr:CBS domain-containing protein [Legionella yabuuchiae]